MTDRSREAHGIVLGPVTGLKCTPGVLEASITWVDTENDLVAEGYWVHRLRLDGVRWADKGKVKLPASARQHKFEGLTPDRKFRFEVVPFCQNKYRREICGPVVSSKHYFINDKLPPGWVTVRSSTECYYYNKETRERTTEKPDAKSRFFVPNDIAKLFNNTERLDLLKTFQDFDDDGSGSLDVSEMAQVLESLGVPCDTSQLYRAIKEVDEDGGGQVEYCEYLNLVYLVKSGKSRLAKRGWRAKLDECLGDAKGKLANSGIFLQERAARMVRDIQGEVQAMFADVSKTEKLCGWRQAKSGEGIVYYYNEETRETRWDMPSSVRFFVPPLLRQQFAKKELKGFRSQFRLFDEDGSGAMDVDEVSAMLSDLGVRISRSSIDFLVKAVDDNASGEIEFDEFVGLMYGVRRGRIGPLRFFLAICGCDSKPVGMPEMRNCWTRLLLRATGIGSDAAKVAPDEEEEDFAGFFNRDTKSYTQGRATVLIHQHSVFQTDTATAVKGACFADPTAVSGGQASQIAKSLFVENGNGK